MSMVQFFFLIFLVQTFYMQVLALSHQPDNEEYFRQLFIYFRPISLGSMIDYTVTSLCM